jgi:hypothetical protein
MKQQELPQYQIGGAYLSGIRFAQGLIGQLQAKQMMDDLCKGCPACGSVMIREADYKCYCPRCRFGVELIAPGGEQN